MRLFIYRLALAAGLTGLLLQTVPVYAQNITSTANFAQTDRVLVVTKVNVRSGPYGTIMGKQYAGAFGTLAGGPTNKNGYTWWKITYDSGVSGWTAEDFMQKPAAIAGTSKVSALSLLLSQLQSGLHAVASDIASVQNALSAAAASSQ